MACKCDQQTLEACLALQSGSARTARRSLDGDVGTAVHIWEGGLAKGMAGKAVLGQEEELEEISTIHPMLVLSISRGLTVYDCYRAMYT